MFLMFVLLNELFNTNVQIKTVTRRARSRSINYFNTSISFIYFKYKEVPLWLMREVIDRFMLRSGGSN